MESPRGNNSFQTSLRRTSIKYQEKVEVNLWASFPWELRTRKNL